MEVKITEDNIKEKYTIHISHSNNMWNGISHLSLDDLITLRKHLRKYIINSKKKKQ